MTFEDWFAEHDWWHEPDAREKFQAAWNFLLVKGVAPEQIAPFLDCIISVMRNEYGD